jgi:hypothetical protein
VIQAKTNQDCDDVRSIKVQNTFQFNWYTHWTSLGANGTPDNMIKDGLKQPNCIKISFEKGAKEITDNIAPNQA